MNETTRNSRSLPATDASASASPIFRRRRTRALALVGATLAGLLVWAVSVPVLGVHLDVGSGPTAQTVTPIAVPAAALIPGAIAWALLALLERLRRGRLAWLVTGWVVLALSLLGPIWMAATDAARTSLLAMHLVVGVTLIIGLTRPRGGRAAAAA